MCEISVITVTLNSGDRLRKTVDSALSQEGVRLQLIIKDGGSKDNSLDFLREIPDPRVEVITCSDNGIYDAMDQALWYARGEYVNFLNAGDAYTCSSVLRKVLDVGKESGADILYTHCQMIGIAAEATLYPKVLTPFFLLRSMPNHQAQFLRREALLGCGKMHKRQVVMADRDIFLELCLKKRARSQLAPIVGVCYEGGGFSDDPKSRELMAHEHRELLRKYFTMRERILYHCWAALTIQPVRSALLRKYRNRGFANRYIALRNWFYK